MTMGKKAGNHEGCEMTMVPVVKQQKAFTDYAADWVAGRNVSRKRQGVRDNKGQGAGKSAKRYAINLHPHRKAKTYGKVYGSPWLKVKPDLNNIVEIC